MRNIFLRRGQNLVDLALVIGVVGLAIIAMRAYIQRGVQGKVKDLADYIISDQQAEVEDTQARRTDSSTNSTMTADEFIDGGRHFYGEEHFLSEYRPPPS